jgi:hypothetical protein
MPVMPDEQALQIDLTDDERSLLRAGLVEWWGPTRPTDALAVAMGFADVEDLSDQVRRLMTAVEGRQPLTMEDWRRVLLATEIAFVDDVFGSGLDWRITTGFADELTITMLRTLQRKMPRWRGSVQFSIADDGQVQIADQDRPHGPSEAAG